MKYDEHTGREEALLHVWDESNSLAQDCDALKARLLAAYEAEAASLQPLEPQDDELDVPLADEVVTDDVPPVEPPAPAPFSPAPSQSRPIFVTRPVRRVTVLTLCRNEEWPRIIDDLLAGEPEPAYRKARSILWLQVEAYVVRHVRLPIGALSDDEDVRRDISVRVLRKLEANSSCHLREWRRRQAVKQDHASFWGWIKVVTWHNAIDYARTSGRNLARRGEPFRWAVVDSVDPFVLEETFPDTKRLSEYVVGAQWSMRRASGE